MEKRVKTAGLYLLGVVTGLLLFQLSGMIGESEKEFSVEKEWTPDLHLGQTGMINPLLECREQVGISFAELKPFRKVIGDFTDRQIEERRLAQISVYFRDLNNGPWFGIHEKEDFAPASLLKVPIMMGIFKRAEKDPAILRKKITFRPRPTQDESRRKQHYPPKGGELAPKSYSVDRLIERLIVDSDNEPMNDLLKLEDQGFIDRVVSDLAISMRMGEDDVYINVKNYATLFRVLYNASYLSPQMSNKALELLSRSDFKEGLVGGVPPGVKVAHKFGERDHFGMKQLHDCGIVYYPGRPYLLCVMTRGAEFEELSEVIREVSDLVFREVDRQVRGKGGL